MTSKEIREEIKRTWVHHAGTRQTLTKIADRMEALEKALGRIADTAQMTPIEPASLKIARSALNQIKEAR